MMLSMHTLAALMLLALGGAVWAMRAAAAASRRREALALRADWEHRALLVRHVITQTGQKPAGTEECPSGWSPPRRRPPVQSLNPSEGTDREATETARLFRARWRHLRGLAVQECSVWAAPAIFYLFYPPWPPTPLEAVAIWPLIASA